MRSRMLALVSFFFLSIFCFHKSTKPAIQILNQGTKTSLRGLSIVDNNIIWVSGSNGKVGKSLNGGKYWEWTTVGGFDTLEFRDIEAFNADTAIIMGVGSPAYILKTVDGGRNWKIVYESKVSAMFLDAMDFSSDWQGMVVGDPVNGQVFLAQTMDGGENWLQLSNEMLPKIDSGEAFFAASGSNLKLFPDKSFYLVSGGIKSNLIMNNQTHRLPLRQGTESSGANAIDIYSKNIQKPGKNIAIVGGDFVDKENATGNCIYSNNGGKTWNTPKTPPRGYRSSVQYISQKQLLTCGLTGVDFSKDRGKNWQVISNESFNVVKKAKSGNAVFLAGNNGKVGRFVFE